MSGLEVKAVAAPNLAGILSPRVSPVRVLQESLDRSRGNVLFIILHTFEPDRHASTAASCG